MNQPLSTSLLHHFNSVMDWRHILHNPSVCMAFMRPKRNNTWKYEISDWLTGNWLSTWSRNKWCPVRMAHLNNDQNAIDFDRKNLFNCCILFDFSYLHFHCIVDLFGSAFITIRLLTYLSRDWFVISLMPLVFNEWQLRFWWRHHNELCQKSLFLAVLWRHCWRVYLSNCLEKTLTCRKGIVLSPI